MKKSIILILMFSLSIPVFSQQFQIHFQDTVAQGQPGDFMIIPGEVINLSATDTLILRMIRVQNNLPNSNWASLICLGVCAPPQVDTLDWPIPPNDTTITDINFVTDMTTPGTATVLITYTTLDGSQSQTQWFVGSTEVTNVEEFEYQYLTEFKLLGNYPNPFNNHTIIAAQVNRPSNVELQIFDVLGRQVYNTFRKSTAATTITFRWDGKNIQGHDLSSGIYFYRVTLHNSNSTDQSQIKKLTLLR